MNISCDYSRLFAIHLKTSDSERKEQGRQKVMKAESVCKTGGATI